MKSENGQSKAQQRRVSTRVAIATHFQAVTRAQNEIQFLQNELLCRPDYNPIELYRRIAGGDEMTISDMRSYLQGKKQLLINLYCARHNFRKVITLLLFIRSLTPYTPNVLRIANEAIFRQLQHKKLTKEVQEIYRRLVLTEMYHLERLQDTSKAIGMDWQSIKRFIDVDLLQCCRNNSDLGEGGTSIIKVRKWLEYWAVFDEYKVLNVIRWFRGEDQLIMHQHQYTVCLSKNMQTVFKAKSRSMSLFDQKNLGKSKKNGTNRQFYKDSSIFPKKSYVIPFMTYLQGWVTCQRRIMKSVRKLVPYANQANKIIQNLLSGHLSVSCAYVMNFVYDTLPLQSVGREQLQFKLKDIQFQCQQIVGLIKPSGNYETNSKLTQQQIKVKVCEVLHAMCSAKAIIKDIWKSMGDKMSEIFAELDTTNHNYLDKNDVNEMLTERGIRHTQEDIDRLLMVFGTGQAISLTSLVATLKTMCGDTSSLLS